ncbi:MAG: DUF4404 family protein [Chloroflexi bacterium]|nr:DUF4404 family protein [Chloroflexota bacterium]
MADDQLHQHLRRLHGELEEVEASDETSRTHVANVRSSMEPFLDPDVATQPHHYHSLRERLGEAVNHFEDSHPRLTLTMGEVLDNLAAIGL